ncbi:MAG: ABC transporter substrate-binding protein [Selenomonadaceae bacterium]|nr:ABC transporter substrate-binding protein [Selenomonadaceae bacterium]
MKKLLIALISIIVFSVLLTGCGKKAENSNSKLVIYTSMKESLIGGIVEGFKKKHPEIEIDYQSAGAGKLIEKIAAERQSGQIMADIIWTSEVPDFYQMKQDGLLEAYMPTEFPNVINPFEDYDGSFTAARLGTLGIVVNTDNVKTLPVSWEEIATNPIYKDSFGIADPALSGTSFMSVALLEKEFGWDYIARLRKNGASKSKGSGQVVDNTASGSLNACLGVDYIAKSKIEKGAPLTMVYPKELLMVPSPIAIFKNAANMENAKAFVNYVLSEEAQEKVAESGTVPVRKNVKLPRGYSLPTPEEAMERGIKVNYNEVLAKKSEIIEKFSELFKNT